MTIKFSEMEPDVQQSALRVIESQFEKSCINGSGYEIAAAAIVKTIVSAYQELYVVVTPKEKE